MGGGSYDRDVYGSSSRWGYDSGYSGYASKAMSSVSLHSSMHPCNKKLISEKKHPIVVMLDVTGSNTNFAKIVYDKMPMFFGQIEQKGYLEDFEIAVCAVGDATCDEYPLQVANLETGIAIDDWLKKLVLEGGGGGQRTESYELAAYYLLKNFEFADDAKPIIFFLGDEKPYPKVHDSHIRKWVNSSWSESSVPESMKVFRELLDKVPNTYLFLNPYSGRVNDEDIRDEWRKMFGPHAGNIINMQQDNEKAIIDLMLGIISMIGGNTLESYKVDMLEREQTEERINSVDEMLKGLSTSYGKESNDNERL